MMPKKLTGKAVWAAAFAVTLVAAVLILLFVLQVPSQKRESIVLPAAPVDAPAEEAPAEELADPFLDVNNENVLTALQSLNRPISYHQTYTVTVGSDDVQAKKNVELWVNGALMQAKISDQRQTQVLISDGEVAYLWYEGNDRHISLRMEPQLTEEDLLGLPAFDAFLTINPQELVDSDYLVLEDSQVQCIYVCTQNEHGDTTRHWVSLDTGLLYQSDVLESSNQVYTVRQTQYETLAAADEDFADRFLLPDGSDPFTAASRMLQP